MPPPPDNEEPLTIPDARFLTPSSPPRAHTPPGMPVQPVSAPDSPQSPASEPPPAQAPSSVLPAASVEIDSETSVPPVVPIHEGESSRDAAPQRASPTPTPPMPPEKPPTAAVSSDKAGPERAGPEPVVPISDAVRADGGRRVSAAVGCSPGSVGLRWWRVREAASSSSPIAVIPMQLTRKILPPRCVLSRRAAA